MPRSPLVASLASVRVWAYCMTEYLMEGSIRCTAGPPRVPRSSRSARRHMAVRQLARKHVREQLGRRRAARAPSTTRRARARQGDEVIDCTLRGNRVRRFKDFDPMRAAPAHGAAAVSGAGPARTPATPLPDSAAEMRAAPQSLARPAPPTPNAA